MFRHIYIRVAEFLGGRRSFFFMLLYAECVHRWKGY